MSSGRPAHYDDSGATEYDEPDMHRGRRTRNIRLPGRLPILGAGLGHHDALTDIFCLGQVLATLALGLDFPMTSTNSAPLPRTAANLFALNAPAHQVLAAVIVGHDGTKPPSPAQRRTWHR